ncbi:glycoside hydrolase family 66 protein [Sphingobium yanoikuyae]|uniref:glycoside hydrolase family 66 protein n=1 Tax=Sphingobium yanoikuyae TaxID=13690 RepID=UPI00240EADB9|nr:glycoside hydrolase family 66 protein [Sphingobium yanoikuyae]MDG2515872.1 glycoside hydrolase family 66 protein [Sphingobium yanoikuyae]
MILVALLALVMVTIFVAGIGFGPDPGRAATIPSLDPAKHRYVRHIYTNKAVYAPGARGRLLVTLANPGADDRTVQVVATIHRNTQILDEITNKATIGGSGNVLVDMDFVAPSDGGERGYRVAVTVKDAGGRVLDVAASAIDVQNSPLNARFPRQCWISHWDGKVDAASLIDSQIAWHCNTVQSYASYYRPELAPPPALDSWLSLSNLKVSRSVIRDVIDAAHAANMPVGFFQATGEAYSDWPKQKVRPSLSWGSFRNRCGLTGRCDADDMDQMPQSPDNWRQYGWQADHLDFFDPCNPEWQNFLLTRSIAPMLAQFDYDFWQADTVGAPVQPTFDSKGASLDTVRCLSTFTSGAAKRLKKPAILNNVSGWGMTDAAGKGTQPYLYRETWDFDTPYYPGLNGVIAAIMADMGHRDPRAIVQPGYINRTLAQKCETGARKNGCVVNPPAALLATAMFAIAGSTWMNHPDEGCIMTNVFVEGYHLPCSKALVDGLLSYKAFEVGYQNLLRDGVRDSERPCQMMSGGTGASIGAAGQVYLLGKTMPQFQICHLLNLTGLPSNAWSDLDGTMPAPKAIGPATMKLYYSGAPVRHGRNRLWWASPDHDNGATQLLDYGTGTDQGGNYVSFTLPALNYWDMVVLERDDHSPAS